MSFYNDKILPHVIDLGCSNRAIMKLRREVIPQAQGQVLEIGLGSGLNLRYYDPAKVDTVWALEPSQAMRQKAGANIADSPVPVQWLDLEDNAIPLQDASIDTVVLTFTLCTIADWQPALRQMHRVLKPSGKLLFCEHGRSPENTVWRWQDRLTPMWGKIAGGCHLNRPIADYLQSGGFFIDAISCFYLRATPRVMGHIYLGCASKAQ